MKVLVITHFYPPEVGAAVTRILYFVQALKKEGHEVKVISPVPNYPKGKKYSGYSFWGKYDKKNNVMHLPIILPRKHSIIRRGFSYITFFLSTILYGVFQRFNPDVVISSSPPIFTSYAALWVSRLRKVKHVWDVRDIWPDIGIELGILKKQPVIKLIRNIENKLLNNSAAIIVTADGDRNNIISKGILPDKTNIIYNGADSSIIKCLEPEERITILQNYNLPKNKKLLVYFGSFNYGMNDIDFMADVLIGLKEAKEKFAFVAIGNGNKKEEFINKVNKHIEYYSFDSLSLRELYSLLPALDISIIPRKEIVNDTGGNIPVKCFESWAAGLPVVISSIKNSNMWKIFGECNAGAIVESGDKEAFANKLKQLIDTENLREIGNRGKKLVVEKFDRKIQSEKINSILKRITT